ncbi:MAG: hypothetical protein R3D98_00590 [Candidatus Krumholzibacteriia bacterium]
MRHRHRILLVLPLVGLLSLPVAAAVAPSFADQVAAVEAAETAELARLQTVMAETTDQAAVVVLQRCASYVKLASRLALHEIQLARGPRDPDADAALADLVGQLRERLQTQAEQLPQDYEFAPPVPRDREVPPCAH